MNPILTGFRAGTASPGTTWLFLGSAINVVLHLSVPYCRRAAYVADLLKTGRGLSAAL